MRIVRLAQTPILFLYRVRLSLDFRRIEYKRNLLHMRVLLGVGREPNRRYA